MDLVCDRCRWVETISACWKRWGWISAVSAGGRDFRLLYVFSVMLGEYSRLARSK
jgi:hypothetical protein